MSSPSYLRLVEDADTLRLELATRVFRVPREDGHDVEVSLVSVMHIAEEGYYAELQERLDAHDVVLYEQVGGTLPLPTSSAELSAPARAAMQATMRRLHALLDAVARFHRDRDSAPRNIAELALGAEGERSAARIERAAVDAWNGIIRIDAKIDAERLVATVTSLGADGEAGGTGADTDLVLTHDPDHWALANEAGLQQDLADGMGLAFQLTAVDYLGVNWRNADVTIEELIALLDEEGADASALVGALQGSTLFGKLVGGLLRFVGSTRQGRGMLKLVGIEALARSDEIFSAPPEGFEALFEVLIARRNEIVVAQLAELLERETDIERVAVFYGAGHMLDLEEQLSQALDLRPAREEWLPAVELRFSETGLPRSQVDFLRRTIGRSLDSQLGR